MLFLYVIMIYIVLIGSLIVGMCVVDLNVCVCIVVVNERIVFIIYEYCLKYFEYF